MKIKNKIIGIVTILIILVNSSYATKAVDETYMIVGGWYGDIPYSYNREERKAVRRSCNGLPVYSMKKNNERGYFYASNIEIYHHEKIKNILKNGYGCKSLESFGNMNIVEAFLATQEAIYIELEGRNINDYVIDSPQGELILNMTRTILENAEKEKRETIEVIEKTKEWQEYKTDHQYKYKEFMIKAVNENEGKIEIKTGENIRIEDEIGSEKQEFVGQDTFYLVVPKNVVQNVQLKLFYEKEGIIVYTCRENDTSKNQYILTEPGLEKIEKEMDIEVISNSDIQINNIDKDTKQPIQGSTFSVQKEDGTIVQENLITDDHGNIRVTLDPGDYYLKQKTTIEGYTLNKSLIPIKVENTEPIQINIESTRTSIDEITNREKEINVVEEDKNIIQNNIKDVSNIKTTNIQKEVINQINETNFHNINHFTNTIHRKNIVNLRKENTYHNLIEEQDIIQNRQIPGTNETLTMTRQDYINYIDMIRLSSSKIPILPVASK